MAHEIEVMAGAAEWVSANAGYVAEAANQAMTNAQVVAAASEELATSIRQVSSQVEHASTVARQAERKGSRAAETVGSLSDAAARIGAVVRRIADIAGRTNLLALNATIEAARAGEVDEGFAVVAGAVKALATQTAKATQEIFQQINALQGATSAAVESIGEIGQTLGDVARISVAVAAAVDQQTAATQEIARHIAESGTAAQVVTQRARHGGVGGLGRTEPERACHACAGAARPHPIGRGVRGIGAEGREHLEFGKTGVDPGFAAVKKEMPTLAA